MCFYITDDGNDSLATEKDRAGTEAGTGTEATEQTPRDESSGYQSQEANLRRDAERLQALINGNILGPRTRTPPRTTARTGNVQFDVDNGSGAGGPAAFKSSHLTAPMLARNHPSSWFGSTPNAEKGTKAKEHSWRSQERMSSLLANSLPSLVT